MKITTTIIRVLLGVTMLLFGLNGFLHFMPNPPANQSMGMFIGAATGYLFPLVAIVEVVCGVFLLLKLYLPFTNLILFAFLIHPFLAHLFLEPAGIGLAAISIAMNIFLLYAYRDKYLHLIKNPV